MTTSANVETDIDDFLIWGTDEKSHDQTLIRCLERMKENNITLKYEKWTLRATELTYLGHVISREGIRVDQQKVRAITEMPAPKDKPGVQRHMGMVNYVARSLYQMSQRLLLQ